MYAVVSTTMKKCNAGLPSDILEQIPKESSFFQIDSFTINL